MAVKAYILVECSVGKVRDVVGALKAPEGIKSVDEVTGPYDVILTAEAHDLNAIGELVTTKLHPIPGINRTVTCLAI